MPKYDTSYYIIILLKGVQIEIGVTVIEHEYLQHILEGKRLSHASKLMKYADGGSDQYTRKLIDKFQVQTMFQVIAHYYKAYDSHIMAKDREENGIEEK